MNEIEIIDDTEVDELFINIKNFLTFKVLFTNVAC